MTVLSKSLYMLTAALCCTAATAETPDRAKAAKQAKTPGRCYEFSRSWVKTKIDHNASSYHNPLLPKEASGKDDDSVDPVGTKRRYEYELQYLFKGKKVEVLNQCWPKLVQHSGIRQKADLFVRSISFGTTQGLDRLSIIINLANGCDFEKIELSTTLYVLVSEREQATSQTFTIPFNSQGKYKFEKLELETFKLSKQFEHEKNSETPLMDEATTYLQNNSKSAQQEPDDEDEDYSNETFKNGYDVRAYQNPSLKSYSQRHGVSDDVRLENMDEQQKKALLDKIDKATSGYTYRFEHPGVEINEELEASHDLSYSDENDEPLEIQYGSESFIERRHIKTCRFDRPSSHLKLKITKYRGWKLLCIPLRVLIEPQAITVLED